jgi:hypothetical protein
MTSSSGGNLCGVGVKRDISDQLRRAIESCGESRYRLWQATGVDQATLSRFMSGKTKLTLDSVDRLCAYLGLQLTKREEKERR